MDSISNLAENSHKYFIEGLSDEGKTFEEAKDYLQSEEIYTSKDYQVGVGVLIDNYSKYTLMFPTVDFASVSSHAGTVYTFRTRAVGMSENLGLPVVMVGMAIRVMEFSNGGYKIRKVFA